MTSSKLLFGALLFSLSCLPAWSQEANYDESQVPQYTLPEALKAVDGTAIDTPGPWWEKRRPEILELFQEQVYGKAPGLPRTQTFHLSSYSDDSLGGKAVRKEVTIRLENGGESVEIPLLIYLPKEAAGPAPLFIGLNFYGNHTISKESEIGVTTSWVRNNQDLGIEQNRATPASRGARTNRWPVEMILARGYGLATIYYGDIDPDFDDGFQNGVHALFRGTMKEDGTQWGSIAAWAWGLSRALDYFAADPDIDERRVAVMGHSRLGKTSLWAGARDERFALVVSNDSGCGGAALSRRRFGETVGRINTSFPHWFCDNFNRYNNREDELPVDQHLLLALIAPRPVYVASAVEDRWADPRGEFLSALNAHPVYRLLGTAGLPVAEMPPVDFPVRGTIGYHIRTGGHDVKDFDWTAFLDFADLHLSSHRSGTGR